MTRCPACGFTNADAARFCGGCGRLLEESPRAERRQLCVLFCDMVGSTTLAGRLDPEDLAEVMRAYHDAAAVAIERYGGYVAHYLGDGVVAYFGFPRAHEDDAVRAVRASLQIIEDLEAVNAALAARDVRLAVRVGLHTGPVVAGQVGARRVLDMALGQTPNVAARLQALAPADGVVFGESTRHLVHAHFVYTALGPMHLAGLDEPLELFQVVGPREGARPGAPPAPPPRPLVGRGPELAVLEERFARLREGGGGAIVIEGEPGIGKSRLVQALRATASGDAAWWTVVACSAHLDTSAFAAVTAALAREVGFVSADTADERIEKLARAVAGRGPDPAGNVGLLAELLGVPAPASPPEIGRDKRRARTIDALVAVLAGPVQGRPRVVVVEDLHWADPSTSEFVGRLVQAAPDLGCLVIVTSRPGYAPPWADASPASLRLARLDEDAVRRIALDVAGDKALAPEVLRKIVERTDGVPLFVEELTKAVLESPAAGSEAPDPLDERAIPTTLKGSLTARLDRLPDAVPVVQLASVIGRECDYELLEAVGSFEEPALGRALASLVDAELLLQRGTGPTATFVFRHALIQDTAYEMLLRRRCRELHERVARTIVGRFPARAEREPETVARHFDEAGVHAESVPWWLAAGGRALESSATVEARAHLEAGLAALARLPAASERDRTELAFQMAHGHASLASRGFSSPEASAAYARAEALCRRLGDGPEQFWARMGLFVFHLTSGDVRRALATAERLFEVAIAAGARDLVVAAESALGASRFFVADFPGAMDVKRRAVAAVRSEDRAMREKLGFELEVSITDFGSMILWHLGEFDEARAWGRRAIDLARRSGHAFTLAHALVFSGCELRHFLREPGAVAANAAELYRLSEERGFPSWLPQAVIFGGWARLFGEEPLERSAADETADGMVRALEGYAATGSRLAIGYLGSICAEGLAALGRRAEALRLVEDGLALVEGSRDHMWEAELHRLRGELILTAASADARHHGEPVSAAEAAFRLALEVAGRQGSLALELRAAISLGWLWVGAGRREEARALLDGVCGRLPDGSGTRDLEEARLLVDAARQSAPATSHSAWRFR